MHLNCKSGMEEIKMKFAILALAILCGAAIALAQSAAQAPLPDQAKTSLGTSHRLRLVLKDGTYQIVVSYTVQGKIVRYVSAERGGTEELPTELVDWAATRKWEQNHSPNDEVDGAGAQRPPIDPELLQEEADRRALTPEVAPDLNLPDLDSVVALDTFHSTPQLVPLVQTDGDLNRTTGHNILKMTLNPRAAQHQILQLQGEQASVQLHVAQPAIYLRVGDDSAIARAGTPLIVNTHGAANSAAKQAAQVASPDSSYVMVRADVRTDARILVSFNIGLLGNQAKPQEDVIETTTELLPGGHWMKITPKTPLDVGEYALVEVISDKEINTGVWDFGVHPAAPENSDSIKPQPRRPLILERRNP
jgi:hypothetical protein